MLTSSTCFDSSFNSYTNETTCSLQDAKTAEVNQVYNLTVPTAIRHASLPNKQLMLVSNRTLSPNEHTQQQMSTQGSSPEDEQMSSFSKYYHETTMQNEVEDFSEYSEDDQRTQHQMMTTTTTTTQPISEINVSPIIDQEFQNTIQELSIPVADQTQRPPQLKSEHSLYIEDFYQEKLFAGNATVVPRYTYQIVQNLFVQQRRFQVKQRISDERELVLRENLIDFISIMHARLKLAAETLFQAVNIFSLFLDRQASSATMSAIGTPIVQSQSQMIVIAVTSLFLASKYEEIYPPSLREFMGILATYMKNPPQLASVLSCEGLVLNTLGFDLCAPTRLAFFEAYATQVQLDQSQKHFCMYLLELTNLNHRFYKYAHSEIAAGVILLSEKFKNVSGRYFWNENLAILTNYEQHDLYACVEELYEYLVNASNVLTRRKRHIFAKYADPKFKGISLIDYDLTNNINNNSNRNISSTSSIMNESTAASNNDSSNSRDHGDNRCATTIAILTAVALPQFEIPYQQYSKCSQPMEEGSYFCC